MSENKNSNNWGCLIGIIIFIIIGLVFFFKDTDKSSIAEAGFAILGMVGLVISYFVCKALFGKQWGCVLTGIVCVIITIAIVCFLTSSDNTNYIVGVAFAIILAIVIGIFMYKSFND